MFLGDATEIDKFSRRLVKVTSTHTNECKELLKLMGIPYVEVGYLSAVLYYNNLYKWYTIHWKLKFIPRFYNIQCNII